MNDWRSSNVHIEHMLEMVVDAYKAEPYEILISESIANALDAGATKINLVINNGFFIVEDNGRGMSEKIFEDYHDLFASTKQKGSTIGFAGIGAKLLLPYGTSIITETKSSIHKASEMKLINGQVQWRYLENLPFNLDHRGTIYAYELPKEFGKYVTKENIQKIIWKNYAAIILGFYKERDIYFNNEPMKPPSHINKKNFVHIPFSYRGNSFSLYLYLSEKPLPGEEQGFAVVIYGKTTKRHFMKLESVIKQEFLDKISGYVIADRRLANLLLTNKEELKTDHHLYKKFEQRARDKIKQWLKEKHLYNEEVDKRLTPNDFTKFIEEDLQKILNQAFSDKSLKHYFEQFQFTIPRETPLLNNNGDINLKLKDGKEEVKGDRGGTGSGNNFDVVGNEEGKGWGEDKEGDEKGRNVTRQRKGINLSIRTLNDEEREYIVSDEAIIIINDNHPTYRKCKRIGITFEEFNAWRCVSMAVIEYSLPQESKKVLKDLSNFLRVWSVS